MMSNFLQIKLGICFNKQITSLLFNDAFHLGYYELCSLTDEIFEADSDMNV